MLKGLVAASLVAGGLLAFSGVAVTAIAAPVGLKNVAPTDSSAVIQVRRGFRGHRGFFFGGHRGFHRFHGGFHGHRHHGRRIFLYGALPFVGYGAYHYGYRYSDCWWLRNKYYATGSSYWYRRWMECRGGY